MEIAIEDYNDAKQYLKSTVLVRIFAPSMQFDGELTGSLGAPPTIFDWFSGDHTTELLKRELEANPHEIYTFRILQGKDGGKAIMN